MRRKSLTPLGETEMEILHHVWALGSATVAQVRERILAARPIAYTTVMTVMKNLNEKGYLDYDRDGATYVYRPARAPEEVRRSLVHDLVRKVFHGSPLALMQTLVTDEDLSEAEREEIRRLIDQMEARDDDTR